MSEFDNGDPSDELKALLVIYSVLTYLARELASLDRPCDAAAASVNAAQASIRERIQSAESNVGQPTATTKGETLIH